MQKEESRPSKIIIEHIDNSDLSKDDESPVARTIESDDEEQED